MHPIMVSSLFVACTRLETSLLAEVAYRPGSCHPSAQRQPLVFGCACIQTGAAAVFEEVLDDAAAPGDRRQPHDLRYQIVLGMRIAVQDIALTSLLIV